MLSGYIGEGRLEKCAGPLEQKVGRFVMVPTSWGNLFHRLRPAPGTAASPAQLSFPLMVEKGYCDLPLRGLGPLPVGEGFLTFWMMLAPLVLFRWKTRASALPSQQGSTVHPVCTVVTPQRAGQQQIRPLVCTPCLHGKLDPHKSAQGRVLLDSVKSASQRGCS